jgi:hypothetical protein
MVQGKSQPDGLKVRPVAESTAQDGCGVYAAADMDIPLRGFYALYAQFAQ